MPNIRRYGLQPRKQSNNIGMGGEGTGFSSDVVYLGKIDYAMLAAVLAADRNDGEPILLQVDLSERDTKPYLPDEDFGTDWKDSYDKAGGFTVPFRIGPSHIKMVATGIEQDNNEWVFVAKDGSVVGKTIW